MVSQVQSFSAALHNHLDMADLDTLDDAASCEKLLESVHALRPLLSGGNDIFHTLQIIANGSSSYLAPMNAGMDPSATAISTDDIEILDNPSMLNSLEHGMLLSNIGTHSSALGISCDELSPRIEHPERWNFGDALYPMWKLQEFAPAEQPNLLSHSLESSLEGNLNLNRDSENPRMNWCQESVNRPDSHMETGLSDLVPEQKCLSPDSPLRHGLSRDSSANDLLKSFDSSDNSDGMDDLDEGMRNSVHGKAPMSKNLVSERRRRKKLNERLYSLRAIVPKISKMDKASIVGDAINYVQDLQKQVEEMQTDIANLQANKDASDGVVERNKDVKPPIGLSSLVLQEPQERKILELEVCKIEEQTFHLRIHCKKGPGVLVQLTKALEALDFEIVNANLTSVSDCILNTIVVKVKNGDELKPEQLRQMTLEVVPKFGLQLL